MSSEYGWSTEYILTRTMKEINWRLNSIVSRKNLDMKFEAQVHGMEIKMPLDESSQSVELNKDQEDNIKKAFELRKANRGR